MSRCMQCGEQGRGDKPGMHRVCMLAMQSRNEVFAREEERADEDYHEPTLEMFLDDDAGPTELKVARQ